MIDPTMFCGRVYIRVCLLLLVCCLCSWQAQGLPSGNLQRIRSTTAAPVISPGPYQEFTQRNETAIIVQSVFDVPRTCPEGFKLSGDRQRCRKIA